MGVTMKLGLYWLQYEFDISSSFDNIYSIIYNKSSDSMDQLKFNSSLINTIQNQSQFLLQVRKSKYLGQKLTKERGGLKPLRKPKYNNSLWTLSQNKSYMLFITQNEGLFSLSNIAKRDMKINVLMSKFVKTRSADQCRSHHQKMMKYHDNIPSIIQYISRLALKEENLSFTLRQDQSEYSLQDFMQIQWPLQEESFCSLLMNQQ